MRYPTHGRYVKKYGRFPKLDPELQQQILEAEKAKEEGEEKQFEKLKRLFKKTHTICGAMQGTGKICLRHPISDNGRCAVHGGKGTGPKTEEGREKSLSKLDPKARLVTGIYSKDFKEQLSKEEVELYNNLIELAIEEYEVDAFNLPLVDHYALNLIKKARLDSSDFLRTSKEYNDPETKAIRQLEALGLNRRFKKSNENSSNVQQVGISSLFMDEEK